MKYPIQITTLALLLGACASAKIYLRTDLYTGPTPQEEITDEELQSLFAQTDETRESVKEHADQKIKLASKTFQLEMLVIEAVVSDSTPQSIASINEGIQFKEELRDNYIDRIEILVADLDREYAKLETEFENRLKQAEDKKEDPSLILFLINKISDTMTEIISPSDNGFETLLFSTISEQLSQLNSEKIKKVIDNDELRKELVALLSELNEAIENLYGEGLKIEKLVIKIKADSEVDESYGTLTTQLASEVTQLAETKSDEKLVSESEISQLVQAKELLESQAYRLKELADPVWKDIATTKKWKKNFGKTRFFAEGNSSVVLVQDDPVTYRIQQGSNNPAALIQGQLKITRAIADASIQIISAQAGIDLNKDQEKDGDPQDEDESQQGPNIYDMEQAINESEQMKLKYFSKILVLKNEWKAAASGTDEKKEKLQDLISQVQAYKLKLASK